MKRLVFTLLASSLSYIANAASFDCSRAEDAVEQAICGAPDLSKIDDDLSHAYADARVALGSRAEILDRDQQNWLADRDNSAHEAMLAIDFKGGPQQGEPHDTLLRAYSDRLEFLRALAGGAKLSEPLAVIENALSKPRQHPVDPTKNESFLGDLAARGAPIVTADDSWPSGVDRKDYIAALPVPPAPALREKLDQALKGGIGYSSPQRWWLPRGRLGSLYTIQGTLNCSYHTLFAVAGGKSELIDMPEVLLGNCWTAVGEIDELAGQPVALLANYIDLRTEDVDVQIWQDGHWSHHNPMLIRYDAELGVAASACEHGDCAKETAAALSIARRFAAKPLPLSLPAEKTLISSEKASYSSMLELARGDDEVKSVPYSQGSRLKYYGLSGFSSMDTKGGEFFPAHLNGQLVLGRIGHGHMGWRADDNWLVGFWRNQDGKLVPIAGVVVSAARNKYLLSVPMPPPTLCGNNGDVGPCKQ